MGPKSQQRNHAIAGQTQTGESLEKSKDHFQALFGNLLEGVQILGHDWRYFYLNASAERHNRRPNQELLGRKYMDMWPGIEETHVFSAIERCMQERVASELENRFVYPDGVVGWFVLSIQPVPEGVFILSFDITERVRAEKQVVQMKRLYATLSQVNQTIVRVKEAGELYRSICDVAVQFGEFSLAWIGLLDEASGDVKPVAANGLDVTQWPFPIINIHKGRLKNGLVASAIRTSKVITSEDVQTDIRIKSLHNLFQEYGYHSSAAVPFQLRDRTIGILNLVSREVGLFKDGEEVRLLEEVGLDISFALDTMENEKIRRQWADAFEHCAHGMAIGLPSTNQILACNPAFARLQGRTIEEISSMSILSMYAPQDHEHVKQSIAEADRIGSVQYEAHMIRKDGSIYPVQMDVVSVRDDDGELLYRIATQQDISERKRAEEELRKSEERYRFLFENNPHLMWVYDLKSLAFLAANNAAIEKYGYTLEEFLEMTIADIRPAEDVSRLMEIVAQQRPVLQHSGEWRHRLKNGTVIDVEITSHTLRMGDHDSALVVAQDVTERKRAQAAVRASQAQLAGIIASAMDAIISLDADQRIILFNPAAEHLFRCTTAEAIGQPLDQFIPPRFRDSHREHIRAFGQSNLPTRAMGTLSPLTCLRTNGEEFPAEITISQTEMAGQKIYTAILRDATERVQAQQTLQASERTLKLFVEYAPAAIAMFDREMVYIAASRRYISDYRLTDDNVVGRSHYEIFPEIPERWKEIHRRCLAGAVEKAEEDPFPRIDGSLDWVRWEIHPWYEKSGEIGGIVLFSEVITERKQTKEAVLESERQMRALVTSLDDIVFEFDEQGTYLNVWAADESLLVQPKAQLLGQRVEEVLGEEGGRPFAEAVKRVLASGHSESIEYPLEVMSGQRWFVARISPIIALDNSTRTVSMLVRDITDRKQTEAALLESEQRFHRLFATSPDAILLIDPHDPDVSWSIVDCNEAACRMNGYTREELIGQSIDILNVTVATGEERLAYLDHLRREEVVHTETIHRHRDGRLIPIEVSTSVINFGGRELVLGIDRDITERKRAEEALRESETRFRSLIENSSDEISIMSANGKLMYESPSANPTLGYQPGEFLDQNLFQLVHPDDLERLQEQFARLRQDPNLHPRDQFRLRHQNGNWRWVEAVGTNLLSEPSVHGIVINYHDITERRQAEEALRESETRYRLATQATNDVIWEWNAKTHELMWTENAQVVFGYLPEEIGPDEKWWDEHIHPDDRERIASKMDALIAGNESIWSDEYRFRRRDNSYAYINDRGYIERDASGEAIRMVGAMSDISERKQADKQVKLQLQRMSALSEIDRAISSSLGMRLSLDVLLNEVLSQLGVDAAAVLLLNESDLTLEYFTGKGFHTLAIRQARMRLGVGLAGQVGLERKVVHLPNLDESGSQFVRADLIKSEGFTEYFGVPLVAKGVLKGVLEIFHRTPLNLDLEWVNYLETLGGQAAIAIDNAQLFEGMQKSNLELIAAYDATIEGWSHAMDLRDKETENHTQRVTELTLKIAETMGVSQQEQVQIRRGALLHDIGKLGIPDQILLKPGKLNEEEWAIMRQHPTYAFKMLASVAYLRPALDIPYCHHEKWDGTGYPRGLRGEQIPLAARIFAVVDVWDALTSDRPYRLAWTKEETLEYIQEQSEHHFDPNVVDVFLETIVSV